jgi:hypothetical protein
MRVTRAATNGELLRFPHLSHRMILPRHDSAALSWRRLHPAAFPICPYLVVNLLFDGQ